MDMSSLKLFIMLLQTYRLKIMVGVKRSKECERISIVHLLLEREIHYY